MRNATMLAAALLVLLACTGKPGQRPVATVNGAAITEDDLLSVLPPQVDSTARGDSAKLRVLDNLIDRQVMVQEALRQGLDKQIGYEIEQQQRMVVNQALYNAVTDPGNNVNPTELQAAYKSMQTLLHLKVIVMDNESLAQSVDAQLRAGTPFETLAARYSNIPGAAQNGGDVGSRTAFDLSEAVRTQVLALKPGEHTSLISEPGSYQLVMLVDSKSNDQLPPFEQLQQQLEQSVKREKRGELAHQYLLDMRKRIEYVQQGVDLVAFKPADSMTDAEKNLPVAIKDKTKYVKVSNLLHVQARFPAGLDSSTRRYAVKREVEDDMMFEDGLKRGLDKKPEVKTQFEQRRRDQLYQALYKKEVLDQAVVTDSDVRSYYLQNKANFVDTSWTRVSSLIRSQLQNQRQTVLRQQLLSRLRSAAKIHINTALIHQLKPRPSTAPGGRPGMPGSQMPPSGLRTMPGVQAVPPGAQPATPGARPGAAPAGPRGKGWVGPARARPTTPGAQPRQPGGK